MIEKDQLRIATNNVILPRQLTFHHLVKQVQSTQKY